MDDLSYIKRNIEDIVNRVNRYAKDVKIVAVSKTFSIEHIKIAAGAGLSHFGENKIQEAVPKVEALKNSLRLTWHFIGHLQSNKVKKAAESFDVIESVDSAVLLQKIDAACAVAGKKMDLLLEFKTSEEETKFGAGAEAIITLAGSAGALANVRIKGLMTMAPYFDDQEKARPYFRQAKALFEKIRAMKLPNADFTELSMGMSGDFEAAVQEGATMVRVGTAIFGKRNY